MALNPEATQALYDYLAPADRPAPADLIIGFGHFDLRIPVYCARLYREGLAPKVLFTGSIGSGTADLPAAEAVVFRQCAVAAGVPPEDLFIEPNSTNTGENIAFSMAMLAALEPPFTFSRALLVANPYRQRRVWLTCRKRLPQVTVLNTPVPSALPEEEALFRAKGEEYAALLLGEVGRIIRYGSLGWIEQDVLPEAVARIYARHTDEAP
jgi:uncharacterized SAM-binding protein YcdF (DUF218 family)